MVEISNSLLIALVGKSKQKRDKVLQVYESLEYNPETKVYKCKSVSEPYKIRKVIYHPSKKQWFCNCPAVNFFKYERFEKLEDRQRLYKKKRCIHILACRLYNVINGVVVSNEI